MADIFQSGLEWLRDKLQAHLSRSVTYIRGATNITLLATPGETARDQNDQDGLITRISFRDYTIRAADIAALGEPQAGDQIREVVGSVTYLYEALPIGSEPCWTWFDPRHLHYLIHTKLVSTS